MFKDIVTKKELKFKELEEEFFKLACNITNAMMKDVLEKYDTELMESRDKNRFRHKGKEKTCIKTKTGVIEYERVKYSEHKEDGTRECRYLLDEEIGITTAIGGHVSEGLIEIIIKNISNLSYRACSSMLENSTGITLSSVGIWNIIQQLGIKISDYEKEKIETKKEEKLKEGEKITPVIFQEADGIMIVMQGKDREKRIKEYKRKNPEQEVPKKVRNGELKLGMTYEGWVKESKNRYKLTGKEYISGFMSGDEMAELMKTNIYSKYNSSKIELNVTNSDGASWIKKLVPEKGIYQADTYHLKEKINTHIKEKEDAEKVIKMYWNKEYLEMIDYVEELKYKYNGEYEEVIKLDELKKYLTKRKESMRRYNDSEEMKKRLEKYSENTGLKYRNMGCQESNNYSNITRRFKKRRMSWSEKGATNLAKVITTYASESCKNIFEYLKIDVLAEGLKEYAERYISEIEKGIKEIKEYKKNVKTPRDKCAIKQGKVLKDIIIENIVGIKEITDLMYR